ncbi:ubiquitin thioesterase zranb1-B isoform X2 [Hoplias malabaricus]|uniref:ubiquitin thioesterase zranb1-B isoform X2 n=1 Tax=Hoplias malabaricus TaxID=27720 RepID=UPI003462BC5D
MTDFQPKWSCEYCTYENWPSAIKCTMCRAQRPTAPIITEEPFKSSTSLHSHLYPSQEGSSVLICPDSSARPRVKISDEAPETTSKWSCHMCTYLNWPRAIRCTQCLSQRQQGHHQGPLRPSETPQSSQTPARNPPQPSQTPVRNTMTLDTCEEYNDRNRLNTHIQQWACSACTYENWPKSLKCVVCDHPKPSALPEAVQQESEAESTMSLSILNEQERTAGVGGVSVVCKANQRRSSPTVSTGQAEVQIELASGAVGTEDTQEMDFKKLKQIRNRMRRTDWLFLNACAGVVEGDLAAVEAYKSSGGDIARQLNSDEVSQQAAKCIPAMVCPELTEQIRREIAAALHRRKGEFPCYFLTDITTFTLPGDIEDLPPNVQEKLFDELLDRDVQKELEEESPIINWSIELGTRLDSRLYALWNRTAGDCLLDSVLQATWGIYDKDSVLRKSLHDSLHDCSHWFYSRWKEWESWYSQSFGLHFSLREEQWQEDWAFILSLASQPGASLEQTHVFVLAHILRRPIIVYGVKYYKSFRGETLGYTRFQGVYLPLLWEQSFCWKSPIALGYTRGHFSALVAMENDGYDNRGAGANLNTDDDVTVTFLPLVDSERKLLHIHFLSAQEMGTEEQQERLLRQWLDCCVTEGGILVALQKSSRRRNHSLVTQMVEKWLDGYRQLGTCPALSDGEEEEEDEDE